ncbi:MAG: hypothetical protein KVP17_003393 [Porospora cf. gigantea B]|uniref:uncharacterized protein n=1 Tax=Porospora cf. gigantea B TaxID=2853592 RepID=UPI003571D943|nr:MAG: hypothetical protein KVP17_003393 [Porospora cf. gigantea B]
MSQLVTPTLPPATSQRDFLECPMTVLSRTLEWEERAPILPPEMKLKTRYAGWLEECMSKCSVRGYPFVSEPSEFSLLQYYERYGQPTAFRADPHYGALVGTSWGAVVIVSVPFLQDPVELIPPSLVPNRIGNLAVSANGILVAASYVTGALLLYDTEARAPIAEVSRLELLSHLDDSVCSVSWLGTPRLPSVFLVSTSCKAVQVRQPGWPSRQAPAEVNRLRVIPLEVAVNSTLLCVSVAVHVPWIVVLWRNESSGRHGVSVLVTGKTSGEECTLAQWRFLDLTRAVQLVHVEGSHFALVEHHTLTVMAVSSFHPPVMKTALQLPISQNDSVADCCHAERGLMAIITRQGQVIVLQISQKSSGIDMFVLGAFETAHVQPVGRTSLRSSVYPWEGRTGRGVACVKRHDQCYVFCFGLDHAVCVRVCSWADVLGGPLVLREKATLRFFDLVDRMGLLVLLHLGLLPALLDFEYDASCRLVEVQDRAAALFDLAVQNNLPDTTSICLEFLISTEIFFKHEIMGEWQGRFPLSIEDDAVLLTLCQFMALKWRQQLLAADPLSALVASHVLKFLLDMLEVQQGLSDVPEWSKEVEEEDSVSRLLAVMTTGEAKFKGTDGPASTRPETAFVIQVLSFVCLTSWASLDMTKLVTLLTKLGTVAPLRPIATNMKEPLVAQVASMPAAGVFRHPMLLSLEVLSSSSLHLPLSPTSVGAAAHLLSWRIVQGQLTSRDILGEATQALSAIFEQHLPSCSNFWDRLLRVLSEDSEIHRAVAREFGALFCALSCSSHSVSCRAGDLLVTSSLSHCGASSDMYLFQYILKAVDSGKDLLRDLESFLGRSVDVSELCREHSPVIRLVLRPDCESFRSVSPLAEEKWFLQGLKCILQPCVRVHGPFGRLSSDWSSRWRLARRGLLDVGEINEIDIELVRGTLLVLPVARGADDSSVFAVHWETLVLLMESAEWSMECSPGRELLPVLMSQDVLQQLLVSQPKHLVISWLSVFAGHLLKHMTPLVDLRMYLNVPEDAGILVEVLSQASSSHPSLRLIQMLRYLLMSGESGCEALLKDLESRLASVENDLTEQHGDAQRKVILRFSGIDDWLTTVDILQQRAWSTAQESHFFAAFLSLVLGWSDGQPSRCAFLSDILECYLKQCRTSSTALMSCSSGLLSILCTDAMNKTLTFGTCHFLHHLDRYFCLLQSQGELLGRQMKSLSSQLTLARRRATVVRVARGAV